MIDVSEQSTISNKPKRPPIIWFTQILLALVLSLAFYLLLFELLFFRHFLSLGVPPWRLFTGLSVDVVLVGFASALFFGIDHRRRWAWRGSILFASILFACFMASCIWPTNGPLPMLPIAPNELLGTVVGEIAVTILLLAYPLRLFFSSRVREFLNIHSSVFM